MQKEVTFTPRLLVVDLKNTLGYLNERGTLYQDSQPEEPTYLWDPASLEVTSEDKIPEAPFVQSLEKNSQQNSASNDTEEGPETKPQNFSNKVHSWVDYLIPRFHPRSINIVKEYKHECPDQPFNIFNYGQAVWRSEQFQDDFSDRIRAYVEECDLMQGFQVLLDSSDGFGGLGSACIEHLKDEYGKSILAFPSIAPKNGQPAASDLIRAVNTALSWQHIGENSSLFSPLCCGKSGWPRAGDHRNFENLSYDLELNYHTSALLATALDTLSLRYRLKAYQMSNLSDLCADLNKLGRKAVATSLSLPFPMTVKRDLIDILDDRIEPLWTSLTPNCEIPENEQMQSLALRGVPEERLKRPMSDARKQMGKPAYRCSTVHEMMTMYFAYTCHASATYLTNVKAPLKISDPFPKIFNDNVHSNGDIASWPVGEGTNCSTGA